MSNANRQIMTPSPHVSGGNGCFAACSPNIRMNKPAMYARRSDAFSLMEAEYAT